MKNWEGNIFKQVNRNDRFQYQYNDNDEIVNLATTRKSVKRTIFLLKNIFEYTKI